MLRQDFINQLRNSIDSGDHLLKIRQVLIEFKSSGGTQAEAYEILENLRLEYHSDKENDLVLEVLDIVSGFCSTQNQVWETRYK